MSQFSLKFSDILLILDNEDYFEAFDEIIDESDWSSNKKKTENH